MTIHSWHSWRGRLLLGSGPASFPARKSRAAICGIQLTFAGLGVALPSRGYLPWFEPGIMCLDRRDDRQAVYNAKRAAGDTHLILEYFSVAGSIYDEGGQPYQAFITKNWETDNPGFLALVEEVLIEGFTPIVVFDGDDGDNPERGHANAMRQLPLLVALLKSSAYRDLNEDVLYARFWDGVFYGSSPEHIAEFGRAFRTLLPHGHLAIEHQPGRIPCGEGGEDFAPNGRMSTYDVICAEYDAPPANDTVWQIAGRTIRPYHRPADQPSGDDPNPPFYLAPGNPRGPYFACGLEWAGHDAQGRAAGTYYWVRSTDADRQSQIDANQAVRAYLRALGYAYTG